MAHDDAQARRPTVAEGVTEPLPAEPLEATAGLPQTVTATTPQPDLSAPPHPQSGQPPAAYPTPAGHQPQGPQHAPYRHEPPREQTLERSYPELRRPRRGRRAAVLVVCAVLGVTVGVAAERMLAHRDPGTKTSTPAAAAAAKPVSATVSSLSPKGNGFRKDGSTWKSEHYASAKFGNLKPGIGLLLDLGSARTLTAVTFTAKSSPLTVELRAGDENGGDPDAYSKVGSAVTANGDTSLPAGPGGKHRYWLIWVTSLAPDDGQYAATITSVTAKG